MFRFRAVILSRVPAPFLATGRNSPACAPTCLPGRASSLPCFIETLPCLRSTTRGQTERRGKGGRSGWERGWVGPPRAVGEAGLPDPGGWPPGSCEWYTPPLGGRWPPASPQQRRVRSVLWLGRRSLRRLSLFLQRPRAWRRFWTTCRGARPRDELHARFWGYLLNAACLKRKLKSSWNKLTSWPHPLRRPGRGRTGGRLLGLGRLLLGIQLLRVRRRPRRRVLPQQAERWLPVGRRPAVHGQVRPARAPTLPGRGLPQHPAVQEVLTVAEL